MILQENEPHGQEGMGLTPDIVLFIGAGVLTVVVIIVLSVFFARIWRAEKVADQTRDGGGA